MAAEILESSAAAFASAANAHLQRVRANGAERDSLAWRAHLQQRVLELAAAVRVGDPALFVRRVAWLRRAALARGGDESGIALALRSLAAALDEELPAGLRDGVAAVLQPALADLARPLEPEAAALSSEDPAGRLGLSYIAACLDGDPGRATEAVFAAIDSGMTPQDIYCRVLMPAQKEVGQLWHQGDVSVGEERLVSETTRRVMAQLAARFEPREKTGPTMLAASVAGNAHDIGLRAVADLFVLTGWRVLYLGANVPAHDVARLVEAHDARLAVLAATLETQLHSMADTIAEIKRTAPQCKVLAGGLDFGDAGAVLRGVGADAHCARIEEAVAMGESLVNA
jgi:methanogenic corrinoid protein MtbC1